MPVSDNNGIHDAAFEHYHKKLDAGCGNKQFADLCQLYGLDPMTPNLRRMFIMALAIGSVDGARIAAEKVAGQPATKGSQQT